MGLLNLLNLGTSGRHIRILKMKNKLFIISLIFFIGSVSAYQYNVVFNPYTNRLDYFQTENYTGYNLTANYFIGDGSLLTNINGTWTQATTDLLYVKKSGDTMTGNLSLGSNQLTNVGQLVMVGVIQSQNIIPYTHNLYTLGNSTNWFSDVFSSRIKANNITSDYLNSTDIDNNRLKSKDINISNNLTIDGYEIREEGGYLIFKLK